MMQSVFDFFMSIGPVYAALIATTFTWVLTGAGAGRLTVTNGNGGDTVLDIDFLASDSHSINIPDDGIRCSTDVYVSTATNITAMTFFYS